MRGKPRVAGGGLFATVAFHAIAVAGPGGGIAAATDARLVRMLNPASITREQVRVRGLASGLATRRIVASNAGADNIIIAGITDPIFGRASVVYRVASSLATIGVAIGAADAVGVAPLFLLGRSASRPRIEPLAALRGPIAALRIKT